MAKILVSLDARLVKRIDSAARRLGLTRSAYIARLAHKALGEPRGPGAEPKVHRAIAEIQRLFAEQNTPPTDWTRVIREMRDARTASQQR